MEEKILTKNESPKKTTPTFGQQYLEGIKAESGKTPVKDIRKGILSEWDENIYELIEKTRKVEPSRHFYVCVTTKREYLVKNTIRNYFESKYACPTPQFEQVVYKINKDSNDPVLLWVIPNKDACIYLKNNAAYVDTIEHELLQYVLDFSVGKLDQIAQIENGEIVEKIN